MSSLRQRMVYQIIRDRIDEMSKTNPLYKNIRISQSTLRSKMPILSTTKTYQFPIKVTDNNAGLFKNNILLDLQDLFVVTGFSFYLVARDKSFNPNGADLLFTGAPWNDSAPALALDNLYDAQLELSINNEVFLYKYLLKRFHKIPTTQFTEFSDAVFLPFAALPTSSQQGIDFSSDGLEAVDPIITFSGSKTMFFNITLPRALPNVGNEATPAAPGYWASMQSQNGEARVFPFYEIMAQFRGVKLQNAATFQV